MLAADVLSSDFELNKFDLIGSLSFIPGERAILAIRLKQPQRTDKLRFVPPVTALLNVTLNNTDGTQIVLAMANLPDDRSIWSGILTSAITANLSGGNFIFSLDVLGDGTLIQLGLVQNGLSLIQTGVCC